MNNLNDIINALGYTPATVETTDDEQDFLDQSDNNFDADNDGLTVYEVAFMNDLDNGLVEDDDDLDELDEIVNSDYAEAVNPVNSLIAEVNRRVVSLTAFGGFAGADSILERYRQGNTYVATNVFVANTIIAACQRLSLNFTRLGNTFIINN